MTLEEALRTGAIIRGMDIEEWEVQEAEGMADGVRDKILKSGDEKLLKFLRVLPQESWARLKQILNN